MINTTEYCTQYGLKKGSSLGNFVDHLRAEHRIKIGTDYWITENRLGVIVRPIWEDDIRFHLVVCGETGIETVRVKDRPGNQDSVLEPNN